MAYRPHMSGQHTGLDDLTCTTWVGNHPADGEPVACWVAHPEHPAHADQAIVLAAAIRAPEHHLDRPVALLDADTVTVTIDPGGGRAALTLWGRAVAQIGCDGAWCDVAANRGWVLLVVTPHTPPDLPADVAHDYLAGRAHLGVVTTTWAT